ncbi:MAG TPA: hypothetical protein VFV34_24235 [Blastocatellia bacterium]|nr:hypothetical protein [Blastocatellia bacterium]
MKRCSIAFLVVSMVSVCPLSNASSTLESAAGDLDLSFGVGGRVITDFGAVDSAQGVVVQRDGKIVVAGINSYNGGNTAVALVRYKLDGSLDTSFGSGGRVLSDLGLPAEVFAVALASDGKIVVAGRVFNNPTYFDWLVARYNSDGSLDTTFGSGGWVRTDFGAFDASTAVVIQEDGKIVASGEADQVFAVARYNIDGTLDQKFGTGGKVIIDSFGKGVYAYDLAIQPDGKIVAVGGTFLASEEDYSLVRLTAKGALDPMFGSGGKVTTNFFLCRGYRSSDQARAIALQKDGKILVAGLTYDACGGTEGDFALARYNSDGSLDSTFGTNGKVTTDFFVGPDGGYDIAMEPNGKIVVAGTVLQYFAGYKFAVARYDIDGNLDATFGEGGKAAAAMGGIEDYALDTAVQLDGKIVVVGQSRGDFAVARFESGIPIPNIDSVVVDGKRMIITGRNFDGGAVLLLNGEEQKTTNDPQNPTTVLIAKKAGKKVRSGDRLSVRNSDGVQSSDFLFAQ